MDHNDPAMSRKHYGKLALMIGLSFISMYILMYAMVDKASSIHPSLNQAYMAALMTAPMVVIELLLMTMMYPRKGWNMAILAVSVVIGLGAFIAIRQQYLIGDREFLRSMIPHHSGAILMCGKAELTDPELQTLCRQIIDSQKAEIELMKRMLERSK